MINETIVLGPKVLLCDSALDAWRLFFKRLKLLAKGALVFISDAAGGNDENQVEDPNPLTEDWQKFCEGKPWGGKSLGEYNPGEGNPRDDNSEGNTSTTISEKGKKGEKQPHPRP